MAGKVTVGLALHCQCVTDFSSLSNYELSGLREDEHPTNTAVRRMAPLCLLLVGVSGLYFSH